MTPHRWMDSFGIFLLVWGGRENQTMERAYYPSALQMKGFEPNHHFIDNVLHAFFGDTPEGCEKDLPGGPGLTRTLWSSMCSSWIG